MIIPKLQVLNLAANLVLVGRSDVERLPAYRRGLVTNLHELGVPDIVIQTILRHEDVSTTQPATPGLCRKSSAPP